MRACPIETSRIPGTLSRKFFKLTSDITLPDPESGNPNNWEPIGQQSFENNGGVITTAQTYFFGTFDGDGHTISNLTITEGNSGFYSLFGILAGTVKNLTLESPVINVASGCVGAIAGWTWTGNVINCHVTGNASISTQNGIAGGVVGQNGGSVTACSFTGTVAGTGDTGDITGYNNAGCTITACYASGIIRGLSDTSPTYVGGVAGLNSGTITASYLADGDVTGYDRVGGAIGEQTGGTASACYWSISSGANSPQYGIGGVNGTDENAVKVTDETGWASAMTDMNSALAGTG